MGRKEIELILPCGYGKDDLEKGLKSSLRIGEYSYRIIRKSLDSRKKDRIRWNLRVEVTSPDIKGGEKTPDPEKLIPVPSENRKPYRVVVVGSGPAGIFSALFLQQSGCRVTLIERGTPVEQRMQDVRLLDEQGIFTENSNYSFGEGGAGTFSDGKLTSRSKHIKKEKQYILEEFVRQGAPEEILYLTHPHIGSDNLIKIAANMRRTFQESGGEILFGTCMDDLEIRGGRVKSVIAGSLQLPCDYALLATGHSAYDSYRMLINKGIPFTTKNFALGCRMEHSQELINRIQWGRPALPDVKAAEYRLTSGKGDLPVYTFCMCPGGKVVPAASYKNQNIVNGMSFFQRDGKYANAALVAGVNLADLLGQQIAPLDSLKWLEELENLFYNLSENYKAPAMTIRDFLKGKSESPLGHSSYQPGLQQADLTALLPLVVASSLRKGLEDLTLRMPGFENGQVLGLESKTSSPIQVLRNRETGLAEGTVNLFICGEASGYAGGIISSASDGLRSALAILKG